MVSPGPCFERAFPGVTFLGLRFPGVDLYLYEP